MEPIPKSGLYYPNKIARIAMLAFEQVMGKNGMNAILNLANLPGWIDKYPPDNLEKQFEFSDFSSIQGVGRNVWAPRRQRFGAACWTSHF
jgi:hypothetical protein